MKERILLHPREWQSFPSNSYTPLEEAKLRKKWLETAGHCVPWPEKEIAGYLAASRMRKSIGVE